MTEYNFATVCDRIRENHDITHIRFVAPMQYVDGAVIEFHDTTADTIIATGRLRFKNQIEINKDTGDIKLLVVISDLVFRKSHLDLAEIMPKITPSIPTSDNIAPTTSTPKTTYE